MARLNSLLSLFSYLLIELVERPQEHIIQQEQEEEVKWNITERYKEIDNLLLQPAYFRRGLQLTGSTRGGKSQVGEMIAEGTPAEKKAPVAEERTLF